MSAVLIDVGCAACVCWMVQANVYPCN